MNYISQLKDLSVIAWIVGLFLIIEALKYMVSISDWLCKQFGIEFKWKRQKQEDHDKLNNVTTDLQEYRKSLDSNIESINVCMGKMTDAITSMEEQLKNLKIENEATQLASQASLGDKINSRYKRYIELNGIPEDEFDEFQLIYKAYKGVGGNHSGDLKYNYCMKLPIIPDTDDKK